MARSMVMTPVLWLIARLLIINSSAIETFSSDHKFALAATTHELVEGYEHHGDSILISPNPLVYPNRQLFVPMMKYVDVINPTKKSLWISARTSHNVSDFQMQDFEDTEIRPNYLLRVPIVYLPTKLGNAEEEIVFSTNIGPVKLRARGSGIPNTYKIRPLSNITIPIGTRVLAPIVLHNPRKTIFRVKEIFTSEIFFHLGLPELSKIPPREMIPTAKLWEIRPNESRRVIDFSFQSAVPGLFLGYVHIKTQDDSIVLPVQIKVLTDTLIVKPPKINFGILTYQSQTRSRTVELQNLGLIPITVQNIEKTGGPNQPNVIVDLYNGSIIPAQGRRKVALTIKCDACEESEFSGNIRIMTNETNQTLTYRATVLHGTLAYTRNSVLFRMPPVKPLKSVPHGCRSDGYAVNEVFVTNRFPQSVMLTGVQLKGDNFEAKWNQREVVSPPGMQWKLCDIFFKPSPSQRKDHSLSASLKVATNISVFHMAMQAFDGHFELSEDPSNDDYDHKNSSTPVYISGDSRKLQTHKKERKKTFIIGETSVVRMSIYNPNPVELRITNAESSVTSVHVSFEDNQKEGVTLGDGELAVIPAKGKIPVEIKVVTDRQIKDKLAKITIKAFMPFFSKHPCSITRRLTRLTFPLRYSSVKGSLTWSKMPIRMRSAFPGEGSGTPIYVKNRFDVPVHVNSAVACTGEIDESEDDDNCDEDQRFILDFTAVTIPPRKQIKLAEVMFNPALGPEKNRFAVRDFGETEYPTKEELEDLVNVNKVWRRIRKEKADRIRSYITFDTDLRDAAQTKLPILAKLEQPRLISERSLSFGRVQGNTSRELYLEVSNPTEAPLQFKFLQPKSSDHRASPFVVDPSLTVVNVIPVGGERSVGPIRFIPRNPGKFEGSLYIRNNLTQLVRVSLSGESIDRILFFDMVPEDDDATSISGNGESSAGSTSRSRQSVEQDGHVYQLMSLKPDNGGKSATNIWRLSMFNDGSDEIIVTGLSAGNTSCSSLSDSDGSTTGKKIQIHNCDALPLHIGPGRSASFRVSTEDGVGGAGSQSSTSGGGHLMGLESFVWPQVEHQFVVNTSMGSHRLVVYRPEGDSDSGKSWIGVTLLLTALTVGLSMVFRIKSPPSAKTEDIVPKDKLDVPAKTEPPETDRGATPIKITTDSKIRKVKSAEKSKRKKNSNKNQRKGTLVATSNSKPTQPASETDKSPAEKPKRKRKKSRERRKKDKEGSQKAVVAAANAQLKKEASSKDVNTNTDTKSTKPLKDASQHIKPSQKPVNQRTTEAPTKTSTAPTISSKPTLVTPPVKQQKQPPSNPKPQRKDVTSKDTQPIATKTTASRQTKPHSVRAIPPRPSTDPVALKIQGGVAQPGLAQPQERLTNTTRWGTAGSSRKPQAHVPAHWKPGRRDDRPEHTAQQQKPARAAGRNVSGPVGPAALNKTPSGRTLPQHIRTGHGHGPTRLNTSGNAPIGNPQPIGGSRPVNTEPPNGVIFQPRLGGFGSLGLGGIGNSPIGGNPMGPSGLSGINSNGARQGSGLLGQRFNGHPSFHPSHRTESPGMATGLPQWSGLHANQPTGATGINTGGTRSGGLSGERRFFGTRWGASEERQPQLSIDGSRGLPPPSFGQNSSERDTGRPTWSRPAGLWGQVSSQQGSPGASSETWGNAGAGGAKPDIKNNPQSPTYIPAEQAGFFDFLDDGSGTPLEPAEEKSK